MSYGDIDNISAELGLAEWVVSKCQYWRDHYETNYAEKHDEYYRLFRGIWSSEDRMRDSERSRIVAPALQQAVESNVAEIETATFATGKIFDIQDDLGDQNPQDMVLLRKKLHEDFDKAQIRARIGEVLINCAVYGTGIAEVVLEEVEEAVPSTRPLMDGDLQEFGVQKRKRPMVKLNPVQPRNFLIDPCATTVDDAMGCAIEEFVSTHTVELLQEQGVYRDVMLETSAPDDDLEADPNLYNVNMERVRLLKYYGLVPRQMLIDEGVDEDEMPDDSMYVEACVVIANQGQILKAIANPYMMQDRPIVAFPWDIVPSRFYGRGVCEKGYMSQKALDAEMRARIDALALTTHPMMAVDATRVPRGSKLDVRPGRMLLTNGNPKDSLLPFNFGQIGQITFAQASALQNMVQQATGAVDGAALASRSQSESTAAGVSMSLGAVMKRQKRTLVNFQDTFLKPFISKAAHRYMQFDPDNYPIGDFKFTVLSSLGIVAREYEVGQLSQLMQVIPKDSPAFAAITTAIVEHLSVSNREEIIAAVQQGSQPNPQAQQAAEQQAQLQLAVAQGQAQLLNAQAAESSSRAQKYAEEARLYPQELALKYSDNNNDGKVDDDFEKRVRIADLMLREKNMNMQEQRAREQSNQAAEQELRRQLNRPN
jgi:hypothetical protein